MSQQNYLGWSREDSQQQFDTDRIIPFRVILCQISFSLSLFSIIGSFEEETQGKRNRECGCEEIQDHGEAVSFQDEGDDGSHHRLAETSPRLGNATGQAEPLAEVHLNDLEQRN